LIASRRFYTSLLTDVDFEHPELQGDQSMPNPRPAPIPPGHEGLIPHLVCAPAADAIEFYKKAFGAEEVHRMPGPDGRLMHAAMRLEGRFFFLADDFPEYHQGKSHSPKVMGATSVTIHRYVTDTDAAIDRAKKAGATVIMPATDMFWGDRYGQVKDPFGHHWALATHIKDMTMQEMAKAGNDAFSKAPC
jgi:PhnB protein